MQRDLMRRPASGLAPMSIVDAAGRVDDLMVNGSVWRFREVPVVMGML